MLALYRPKASQFTGCFNKKKELFKIDQLLFMSLSILFLCVSLFSCSFFSSLSLPFFMKSSFKFFPVFQFGKKSSPPPGGRKKARTYITEFTCINMKTVHNSVSYFYLYTYHRLLNDKQHNIITDFHRIFILSNSKSNFTNFNQKLSNLFSTTTLSPTWRIKSP